MTIRGEIFTNEPWGFAGWVEVDPFNYEYTGPDPDGEIEAFLSSVSDGSITFEWAPDADVPQEDYPPEFELLEIENRLTNFDEIWTVKLPSDFDAESVTYG